MLTHLDIRNVVLIDHLALDVGQGLSVLTGETGAGKSILLDALGLLRGDRSDVALVRKGTDQATVSAAFDVPVDHAVRHLLSEQGIACDDVLTLRRVVGMDGKSRAFINDTPATIAFLKTVGQMIIDLHGQFETSNLFDPSHHRDLVDMFGDLMPLRARVRDAWYHVTTARRALLDAQARAEAALKEQDYIRAAYDDLVKLAPQPGEESDLLERKNLIAARAQIVENLGVALDMTAGDDGATTKLNAAARALERLRAKLPDRIEAWTAQIDVAMSTIRDAVAEIESVLFDTGHGDESLDQLEDRLHDLRSMARRFACTPDDLPDKLCEFSTQLEMIDRGGDVVATCAAQVQNAEKAYAKIAGELSAARVKAAKKLSSGVMAELPPLKLDRAVFDAVVEKLPSDKHGADGMDAVRFMVATNPGSAPGPLDKIASGGELSRLMLALKVVMASATQNHLCMIFDEVDSGLGGAVAAAMADRLARLAQTSQVLVVTHAPQVAARAHHHLVVAKAVTKNVTTTSVTPLGSAAERREEIARMLSGTHVSDEARAAAQKLLDHRAA